MVTKHCSINPPEPTTKPPPAGHQPALDFTPTAPPIPHPTGTGNLPPWIAEQLQANKRTGNQRIAHYQRCHKCDAIILAGLDNDTAAFTARVDPTPLTPPLELATILAGRRTYAAWPATNGYHLEHRDHWNMEDWRLPVLPAHHCGARYPGFLEPPHTGHHHNGYPDPTF